MSELDALVHDPGEDAPTACSTCAGDPFVANEHTHGFYVGGDEVHCEYRYGDGHACGAARIEHGSPAVDAVEDDRLVCWCLHSLHFDDCDGMCHIAFTDEPRNARCYDRYMVERAR